VIPDAFIVEWSNKVGWPTPEQVEQDLVLSRLILEIAGDPYLGEELVFRGGTCLHKFHFSPALRYSEDLDYVRRTADGIGRVFDAVRTIGERLGMRVDTRVTEHPKAILRAPFESGNGGMRVKVEVNTHELLPARDVERFPFGVDSQWFKGQGEVQTLCPEELVATKLRALYQRSKGRDLFDLWLALTHLGLKASEIVERFGPYRPSGYTGRLAEANLRRKLGNGDFRNDLRPLVAEWPSGYKIDSAAELVIADVFTLL
jgi:predicted nucleotidyltransferase component of viral defense system